MALVGFGALGLLLELALLEHWMARPQLVPLAVLTLGIGSALMFALRPGHRTGALFRAVMGLAVLAGVAGIALHLSDNLAFEREIVPDADLAPLLWAAFHGATPLLAPGSLVQLGLVGLVLTYGHPALQRSPTPSSSGPSLQHETIS